MSARPRPDVFAYSSYRTYLQDIFIYLKQERSFTVRDFAKHVGFGSSSYLNALVQGKRSLKEKTAKQIARRLVLNRDESEYFLSLVRFNDGRREDGRQGAYQELLSSKRKKRTRVMVGDEYQYFSRWYFVAILEGLGTAWRTKSSKEMAIDLNISEAEVVETLSILQKLQLIQKGTEGWEKTQILLETPARLQAQIVRNLYKDMIAKAHQSIDSLDVSQRFLGGVTLSLSLESFYHLQERLFEIQKDLNQEFSRDDDPQNVYQLNLQLFPLMNVKTLAK